MVVAYFGHSIFTVRLKKCSNEQSMKYYEY